ncbi:MAG: MetQ/NlpA family ABC transporter substrate-binding protein, partial [Clostridia bacterium]|nr:MetQ/NlpA family ABC transporter substrate-binding protein [Clostridia bacterium]
GFAFGCSQSEQAPVDGQDSSELKVVKIGATPVPHAEILEFAKPLLKEKGIDLQIEVINDYVIPNNALAAGDLDANYFQHLPYLEDFSAENNLDLTWTKKIHFEPLGLYSEKIKSLDEIEEGAEIAVPDDVTNEARALLLLQDNGLIKIDEAAGLKATKKDIIENSKNIEIVELPAEQIPRALSDVTAAIINGNYAIGAGLSPDKDAIVAELPDSLAADTYANIVAVKKGDENREDLKVLDEVLTSPEVKEFIEGNYQGAVVPVF